METLAGLRSEAGDAANLYDGESSRTLISSRAARDLSSNMVSTTAFRLRKHADYQSVYKRGRKQFAKNMAYFAAPREPESTPGYVGPRVGLTVPKALGKAVDRNRIKRRMREAVKANLELLEMPVDVVLHPRRSVLAMEFAALVREVGVVFRSAGQRAGVVSGTKP